MKYLSVGSACQVTHQLRRVGVAAETLFYDWLVTRHDRLLQTLKFDFVDRLFREGYTLPEAGNYLMDIPTLQKQDTLTLRWRS